MNKTVKKVLLTVLIPVAVVGAIWGGLVLYRNLRKEPVNVYPVKSFAMTDYWGDDTEAYGTVTTDKLQLVTISETQTVKEVYVSEGQEVKTGDPLLAYDTTLSDIELEKAETECERLRLQLETAKQELTVLKNTAPYSRVLITPPSSGVVYTSVSTPQLISGSGTSSDPYYWIWGSGDMLTAQRLESLFPETAPATESDPEGETEEEAEEEPVNPDIIYVAFVTRKSNALNGPVLSSWGLKLDRTGGSIRFTYYEPQLSEEIMACEEEPEPYYEERGSYSAAELAQMRSDKEQEIKQLEIQIQIADVELKRLQEEVSDGIVRSTLDGVVKAVRDPDEAFMESKPVVEVSCGGGYYVEASMSELELDSVSVGDPATVTSWMTGMSYEGEIVSISTYPSESSDSWTNGNNNVSWYPFTVFISEDASLSEYEGVSVQYNGTSGSDENAWYLENEFIRTENGRSFVYVRGADGTLEKRTVQTGVDVWGSYTQIRGGITLDDLVAFPYGSDVEEGAATTEATAEDFYASVY